MKLEPPGGINWSDAPSPTTKSYFASLSFLVLTSAYAFLEIVPMSILVLGILGGIMWGNRRKHDLARIRSQLALAEEMEEIINYFSTSLFGQNTVDEILWDVAKNCIGRLGLEDCVIYLLDEKRQMLIQKAAYGNKNPGGFAIYQPIEIPVGEGIVGHVARTGQPQLISDTSRDPRYIQDDQFRSSELAVPLIYNHKVIGVIDSEHSRKNFFTDRHLRILTTISALCANKVTRAFAEKEHTKALKLQMEADKLKAFDELKTKLFTNISHELRTPLTLMMATIDKHRGEQDSADWAVMKEHADRILRLMNQLLDLSRLQSGVFYLDPKPGDVSVLFHVGVDSFASYSSDRDIRIELSISEEPLWLQYDKDALEKIVYNLLSNAVKYTKANSTVRIRVGYDDGLSIRVADEGAGIPTDEQHKIFRRFHRASDSRIPGTGIGLAITKELVELHGGSISVRSDMGQGSEFVVLLPLERAVDAPLPPHHQSEGEEEQFNSQSEDREQVLIIEDNPEISNLIKDILSIDYLTHQAGNGEIGIRFAENHLPDLIICDLMMPGMDGLEVCQHLRSRELTNHIPVIFLTAKASRESRIEGLKTGADAYLVKPFDPDELKTRVQNLLDQRRTLREKYQKVVELHPSEIVITSEEEVFLKKLMETVEENMDNSEFDVQDLCLQMAMSRMQLYRKVKAMTNQTVAEFIRHQRLLRAAHLLQSGELVSQVAYSVGYTSLSNFSKIFKEKYGVLPSEYGHD